MSSDRIVSARHLLDAVMELQRRGSTPILSELEKLEPDLVEHLLEGHSQLHHQLQRAGLSCKQTRQVYRRAESTALVCIMALRGAYRELWRPEESGEQGASAKAQGELPQAPPDDPPPT